MAVLGVPLINGVQFTHADIKIIGSSTPFVEIQSIEYADTQEITLNYGAGSNKPTSRGFQNIQPTATLVVSKKDADRLQVNAPGGRIQNYPAFDLGISYITEQGDFNRHKLIGVKYKGRQVSSSVNNSMIEETLELSIVDIDYNATF